MHAESQADATSIILTSGRKESRQLRTAKRCLWAAKHFASSILPGFMCPRPWSQLIAALFDIFRCEFNRPAFSSAPQEDDCRTFVSNGLQFFPFLRNRLQFSFRLIGKSNPISAFTATRLQVSDAPRQLLRSFAMGKSGMPSPRRRIECIHRVLGGRMGRWLRQVHSPSRAVGKDARVPDHVSVWRRDRGGQTAEEIEGFEEHGKTILGEGGLKPSTRAAPGTCPGAVPCVAGATICAPGTCNSVADVPRGTKAIWLPYVHRASG